VLVLSVIQGPDKGRRFELPDHEPQLIGRSSEAILINDTTLSRRHAELTPDSGQWFIRDLASQNGTYVNGVKIDDRTRLRLGDQIRVGQTLLVFGVTDARDPDVVRFVGRSELDTSIERTLASNEDSIILAEPEPRAAAVHHLRIVYKLTTLTAQSLDRGELLAKVMDLVFDEFQPERGVIVLDSGDSHVVRPEVVRYRNAPRDADDAKIRVSRTIIQHAMRHGEGVLCTNAMNDPRFASGDSVQRLNIRSAICSPIKFRERVFGTIYVDSSIANYTFTGEQLALMNAIGLHTGLALANAELYSQKVRAERLAAVGETVASLSHSIKNILQGLRGGADLVEIGLKKDDMKLAKGGWAILKRNLDRIIGLALNMLAYSRQRRPELQLIKLGPLMDDCAQLLEGYASSRRVALIVDVDPEMPPIPVDTSLLHQAVMNLMTNALEAVEPQRGAVTCRAAYHAGEPGQPAWAEINVIDNGTGIAAEKLAWIFEPFNTTKGQRGTGLGLAVTKRIAEEHGGRVEVSSRTDGPERGSTFRMILPADAGRMDPSATAHSRGGESAI